LQALHSQNIGRCLSLRHALPEGGASRRGSELKICVLGAGALGCAIGGALAEAGCTVSLVTRNAAHVEAINCDGLQLVECGRERSVTVRAATDCSPLEVMDLVIVLVKSFHTRQAIESARTIVGPSTVVLSLQNGLGHEDVLAEVVGREKVMAGKTYVGGVMLAPGRILAGTAGKETLIGELDGVVSARALAIRDEFRRAGLLITVSDNIVGTMWDKLLVNVATGALSGITRLTYGELYRLPDIEACALAAVGEAMAVAKACDVVLATRESRDAWLKAAEGLPADFKTSMLQSLEKGSATEIDFINGAVVRSGQRCGVATPVNQTLVAGIKGIEHRLRLQTA
jgi:2-dehydropantoate 2-reductase